MTAFLESLKELYRREPIRILNTARALMAIAVIFGVDLSTDKQFGILAALELMFFTPVQRKSVVSPQTIKDAGQSVRRIVADAAEFKATGL